MHDPEVRGVASPRPVGTGLQILGSSKRAQVLKVMVRSVRISHECNQQNLYKQERFRILKMKIQLAVSQAYNK